MISFPKKKVIVFVCLFFLSALPFFSVNVHAANPDDFNEANIIDDVIFFDKNTMSVGDIQNFLNSKMPTCDTWHAGQNGNNPPFTCLKDYTQSAPSRSADAYCGGIAGGVKSAAQMIYDASQACGVNPRVMIVLLQKEQALVTDTWPWDIQYRSATGYGCPDTAACDSEYYGLANQLYYAARQFKRYVMQPNSFNYAAGRNSYVLYNPNSGCGGSNITIQNGATAALYNYTPYQPNQAAMDNLYGSGDSCSAYGNRNFWRLFTDWFGPTRGAGYIKAISDNPGDPRQWVIYNNMKQHIPDAQTLRAWGIDSDELITFSSSTLDTIPSGPPLGRLTTQRGSADRSLYFVDGGKKYRVPWNEMVVAMNWQGSVVSDVSPQLFNTPSPSGDMNYAIKRLNSSTKYIIDGKDNSNQTIIRPFQNDTVLAAWEASTNNVTTLSDDYMDTIDNAIGQTISNTKITLNAQYYEVYASRRMLLDTNTEKLYPGVATGISQNTFTRLAPWSNATHIIKSSTSPSVYLIDNGLKKHIIASNLLSSWSAGKPTITVNQEFVDLIPSGAQINNYTADVGGQLYVLNNAKKISVPVSIDASYRSAMSPQSSSQYLMNIFAGTDTATPYITYETNPLNGFLLDRSGTKRPFSSNQLRALAINQSPKTSLANHIVDGISTGTTISKPYVSDGLNDYILENGNKTLVTSQVKNEWGLSNPVIFSDNTLQGLVQNPSSLGTVVKNGNEFYMIKSGQSFGTVDRRIADLWNLPGQAQDHQSYIITTLINNNMLTRFVKSSVDNRIFVIDNANWYNLPTTYQGVLNIYPTFNPIVTLNPTLAPNTITDWSGFVVVTGTGQSYVLDKGIKRPLINSTIKNQWTVSNSHIQTISDHFMGFIPTGQMIERSVKSQSGVHYFIENGTKRQITNSSQIQNYAPYSTVSDDLLNAIPSGQSIN